MDKVSTRVAIVSDQPIYLRGLASLLISSPGFLLVGEARSGAEAVQLAEMTGPDLAVLDFKSFQDQGYEIVQHLRRILPATRLVLMLRPQDQAWAQGRFDEMPVYCFSRDTREEDLITALEQIRRDTYHANHGGTPTGEGPDDEGSEGLHQQSSNEELMSRELSMAGKIQSDILPELDPAIPGWDIVARLEPARETSGDFFDFIPLSGHKLGITVADVSDKGMGAALFMALSSSLLRTYAARFPTLPAVILSAVSERILSDTRGGMFVTAFFGTLETHTGRIVFANAGHPPGFLICTQRGRISVEQLRPTGMALGVSEEARWKQKLAKLLPGDFLVLYTDGITEAQNHQGQFFGEELLLDAVLAKAHRPASEIAQGLLDTVHRFIGSAPKQDDIAVLVIRRKE